MQEAGVTMTGAGATFPMARIPRTATSSRLPCPVEELEQAIAVLCGLPEDGGPGEAGRIGYKGSHLPSAL
ncbi:MAG: hypothetical protein ACLTYN_09445 [Dysosmobacter welbionis]